MQFIVAYVQVRVDASAAIFPYLRIFNAAVRPIEAGGVLAHDDFVVRLVYRLEL